MLNVITNIVRLYSLLQNPEDVLKAVKFMVAVQLSKEPLVRKVLREAYFEKATINVVPTMKGIKEIDENHACYRYESFRASFTRNANYANYVFFLFNQYEIFEKETGEGVGRHRFFKITPCRRRQTIDDNFR